VNSLLIYEYLEKNAQEQPDEIALVEINPRYEEKLRITWKDYALMQPEPGKEFRREITWKTFDEKAKPVCQSSVHARCPQRGQGCHSAHELH